MEPSIDQQPLDQHDQQGKKPQKLEPYFRAMVKARASDLHFKAGVPPHIRTQSLIRATKREPLTNEEIQGMADELMTPKQQAFFHEHGSIDLAHELPGSDRFRLNIFRQRGRVSISVRRVTREIPDFETLHLPRSSRRSPRSTRA